MKEENWHKLGLEEELRKKELQKILIGKVQLAVSYKNGVFGAISNICNHVGGPLGEGKLDGDFVVCPWHFYKFHRIKGEGEPGFESDKVPMHEIKIENGEVWVNLKARTKRNKLPHDPHPLERPLKREPGKIRVAGISTTNMTKDHPRYSTSEALLEEALLHAKENFDAETKKIKLMDLRFRSCEGFYSKSAQACTWPCSITQMDSEDQMDQVYEAMVHWADVIVIATPIRWGAASSLYYKMVERMNCIQNQVTIKNRELIKNKVASFIITGGQDNIQAVAGQMLGFFAELGFLFPPYPYIAHSLGWSAENMERNVNYVRKSKQLREGANGLLERSINLARSLIENDQVLPKLVKGGRKAQKFVMED